MKEKNFFSPLEAKIVKISIIVSIAFTTALVVFILLPNLQTKREHYNQWTSLKSRSEAHGVIVSSYRECREKADGGSPSECQLMALNYGKARGYKNASKVFKDIIELSQEISKNGNTIME